MAPPDHAKNNKPKPAKPTKALAKLSLFDFPAADERPGELVAVTNDEGLTMSLAYSDGDVWLEIAIAGELAIPTLAPEEPPLTEP
jgi:hypothetical protein